MFIYVQLLMLFAQILKYRWSMVLFVQIGVILRRTVGGIDLRLGILSRVIVQDSSEEKNAHTSGLY